MNPVDYPTAFTSPYSSSTYNDNIPIYAGPAEIIVSSKSVAAEGKVEFRWQPFPRVYFEFTTDEVGLVGLLSNELVLCQLPNNFQLLTLHCSSTNLNVGNTVRTLSLAGEVEKPFFTEEPSPISKLVFHIVNFHKTSGSQVVWFKDGVPVYSRGRTVLDTAEWAITIDDVADKANVYASLKASRGYGITHIAEVSRRDGSQFGFEEFIPLGDELSAFLSFARGCWIEPFLYIGNDASGTEKWVRWSKLRSDPWMILNHWFPHHDTSQVHDFWLKFRARLNEERWGDVLKRAIQWYILCNKYEGQSEGAIIMAQAALELLAWTRFVGHNGVSVNSFDSNRASDRLRMCLSEAKIPLTIPTKLQQLVIRANASEHQWQDGPHAITGIRNMLVHPTPVKLSKLRLLSDDELYQGYMLSMWYLELLLLFYFDYQGEYYNRCQYVIHSGATETVPWVEN